jgi:hypothetical protein
MSAGDPFDEEEEYEECEEETTCAEGFTADEDCDSKTRYGIEYCEFCCPWHLLDTPIENNPKEEGKTE